MKDDKKKDKRQVTVIIVLILVVVGFGFVKNIYSNLSSDGPTESVLHKVVK